MAKSRMVSADIRIDEEVNKWPIELRFFWIMLWGYVDDFGRGRYNARLVKADMFPLDDDATAERVERWLHGLVLSGRIVRYEVDGEPFFEIPTWSKWQKLARPAASKIPEPLSGNAQDMLSVASDLQKHAEGEGEGEVEKEGEGEDQSAQDAPPPPHCSKHQQNPDAPCGACKRARIANEAWLKEHQPPPPPAIWDCEAGRHKWTADGTCTFCDARKEAS